MEVKKVVKLKRSKDKFFETGDDITSKAILYDLYYSGKMLSRIAGYEVDSKTFKPFLDYVIENTNNMVKEWDDINTKPILRGDNRPYVFEIAYIKKEDLINDEKFTSGIVKRFSEALDFLGYHFDTNFTELDIKKLFVIMPYLYNKDINIKLSLEDDEICDYNKKHHIGKNR